MKTIWAATAIALATTVGAVSANAAVKVDGVPLMQTAPATIDASAYKDIGGDTYAGKGSWTPTGFQWNTGSAPKTLDSLRRGGFFRGRY